ncbi:VirB8 protein [Edaphobacter aggregans]|uniref:VirB8 protein n=1 Tax=Edaphobacter aggregans TaxID=570835 RepID=A0A3R9QCS2_9BACT|nr:VirB8/TrbF family protein [Edaphobacter aggregans]RSL18582.1 VirB8 protein [Edaphobacter aggregans]
MEERNKQREPKFYEMDGALRAYSNRSIAIAGVMGLTALIAVMGFFFVRMQPPTVIKVDSAGQAQVVSPYGASAHRGLLPSVLASARTVGPDEYEKQAFIKQFLGHYLSYDPHTLGQNWADAMNMMTSNLRHTAIQQLQKDNAVGKLENEQAMSTLKLGSLEPNKENPLTYEAFGVRTVHRMVNEHEITDKLVEQYHLRLVSMERSADNPDGLLVGEYWSRQIEGEKRDAVLGAIPGVESENTGGENN